MTLLTPREEEVARLVAENKTAKKIARELGIAESTVRNYVRLIAAKLPGAGKPMQRIALWWHRRKARARRASQSEHPIIKKRQGRE